MTHTGLIARLRLKGPQSHEQPNHHVRRMEIERIEAADALTAAQDENERLRKVLLELADCVDDGCYCSEMKMAAAVDEARAALDAAGKGDG